MKRVISLLLAIILVLTNAPLTYAGATELEPTITVASVIAAAGGDVDVNVNVKNNPGVAGAKIKITYSEKLTLTDVVTSDLFSSLDYTVPPNYNSGCALNWDSLDQVITEDGTWFTLKFHVSEDAAPNEALSIQLTYDEGNIYNGDLEDVNFAITNGSLTIIDYIPGDVNSDGVVNGKDVTVLRRYNAEYAITIREDAADVNDDNVINGKDVTLIRRYNAEYDVELKPHTPRCQHTMEAIPFKAATCEEDGNVGYYHCTTCDKYYNNSNGTTEITLSSTVLPKTGHTAVTDPYVAPTPDSVGWTEGSHCSVCKKILVAQTEIPKVEVGTYAISYNFTDSDPYLQSLVASGKLVNSNPEICAENETLTLKNLTVAGYKFEGWFDGPWADANRITKISKPTESIELYAKWTKITYTVEFDSPDIPIASRTYTVDTGVTLENPDHFGYTFLGWSLDGKIMSNIPVGMIGNITLRANWTSDRNKAVAKTSYGDPIVIEDMDNGRYLFIYEIGEIHNVPITELKRWDNVETLELNEEVEVSEAAGSTFTENIARVLSNATTSTSSWTLSEDWNNSSSAMNESEEEIGKTDKTTNSAGNTVEGKYFISNVKGGSTSTTNSAGGSSDISAKVTTGSSVGITDSYSNSQTDKVSVGVESEVSASVHAEVEAESPISPVSAKAGYELDASIGASAETSQENQYTTGVSHDRKNSFGTEYTGTSSTTWDSSSTSTSEWNTTQSYESAVSSSQNEEVSRELSTVINNKLGYSSTEERGGENSETQSKDQSTSESNEYATTVEYSKDTSITRTESVTRTYTTPGSYRLVSAGTVHVFAVVGFDIATNSYFTHTYNILDSDRHLFVDYSKKDNTFKDCENAILPFEVPYTVKEYVDDAIARSAGLIINPETGIVEKYEGTAEYVLIPEYISASDDYSKPHAVKVSGISANAFANNPNVKGVYLPSFVSTIPNRAFENCTALEQVYGYGITTIGDYAFSGCTSMYEVRIDEYIESIGTEAFKGVPGIKVTASNEDVADAAIASGAKRITLDITGLSSFDNRHIEIPETSELFALVGNSSSGVNYSNLRITSDAKETVLSNMTFVDNRNTPLDLSSEKVSLNRVVIQDAPGYVLMMSADHTTLSLYGNVTLGSSGEHAVISRDVTMKLTTAGNSGNLKLSGNYLICGEISNSMLGFDRGELRTLTEEEYQTMLTSSILTFDPNGGEVDPANKQIYYGQSYGEMPIPTKTGYEFVGWFTEAEEGTEVTADAVVSLLANQTVYAHWTPAAYALSWNEVEGYSVTVTRTESPYAQADSGELSNGAEIYFGDKLTIAYGADPGYTVEETGITELTVETDVTSESIHATTSMIPYTATWSDADGYTIAVSRTESPKAGAETGALSSGATVYYGDVLSVSYTRRDYYNITSQGEATVTVTGDVAGSQIYATAELKPLSDWVKDGAQPSGSQVVNQKWSYTQKYTTESKETSLSGYTQTGSYWVQSGTGSQNYASFPSGFDTSNSIYTSFAKSAPHVNSETATTKREVTTAWAGYVYWHWMYDCGGANGTANRAIYNQKGTGPDNGFYYKYFGAFTSTNGSYSSDTGYCNSLNIRNYIVTGRTAYADCQGATRWFRFDYYKSTYTDYYKMFQYEKYENKESSTAVTASSTISNVQKWVQYREK